MTDHDDARLHASARADGEEYDAALLAAHLPECADCRAYDDGLARLSTLTAALPREPAPDPRPALARRVRRRRLLRLAPALAAATAVAVAVTVLPSGTATFAPPGAAAAEPLRTLRSLYLERTVTGPEGEFEERIWFRAPVYVRVDRVRNGTVTTTRVETPHLSYDGDVVTTNAAPTIPLPEPLSPTVSLLGEDTGEGPVIAGRPTRTVVLTVGRQRRTAYVDTERALALGGDEVLILGKQAPGTTKRVTRVDRDPVIPYDVFAPPPEARRVDGGFTPADLGRLSIEPDALPKGFASVASGRDAAGESALFVDGSLPLLVTTRPMPPPQEEELRTVARGDRVYLVTLDLYAPPSVQFLRGSVNVSLVAPLPVEALVDLAERMYPRE